MIIGLMGYKQVGKSTAAKYLEEKYGFVRINFKDALIEELKSGFPDLLALFSEHYGLTIDELFEQKPPMMRALMQNFGTEVRRADHKHYWIQKWAVKVLDAVGKKRDIVVDDVRFRNEGQAITAQRGVLIRLTRPDVETGGTHSSETEMESIVANFTIPSLKGEHEVLYHEIDKVMKSI